MIPKPALIPASLIAWHIHTSFLTLSALTRHDHDHDLSPLSLINNNNNINYNYNTLSLITEPSVRIAIHLPPNQNISNLLSSSRAATATMTEWTKKKYNEAYTEYMPWIEDKVLGYWGENKTSYTAKGTFPLPLPSLPLPSPPLPHPTSFPPSLPPTQISTPTNSPPPKPEKLNTDVTGDKNVQAIQGGIAEGVGGQLSSGGLLGGVGDMTSKEGVNRAERGDPGLDPKELEKLNKQKEKEKGWTETLSMGYLGGSK